MRFDDRNGDLALMSLRNCCSNAFLVSPLTFSICPAARLFETEVLELKQDIPRKELCDIADDYIYYQTDDLSRV
jgi:hypothetical protein